MKDPQAQDFDLSELFQVGIDRTFDATFAEDARLMGSEDVTELLSIIVLNEITRIARGSIEKGVQLRKNIAPKPVVVGAAAAAAAPTA